MNKSTKFMDRIYSAQQNNESKLLTQIYADIHEAQNMGQVVTKQLDYEKLPNGTIRVKDKLNKEETNLDLSGDQIVMTPMSWGSNPPADNIVGELEGTPSIPDDIQRADSGVIDKEKAGLVGNDDTHYPTLQFSDNDDIQIGYQVMKLFSELDITEKFFAANDQQKAQQVKASEIDAKAQSEKVKAMQKMEGVTKGQLMVQQGKALVSKARANTLKRIGRGALMAAAMGAVGVGITAATGGLGTIAGGAVGALGKLKAVGAAAKSAATLGAISGARGAATGEVVNSLMGQSEAKQGKKLIEEGRKLMKQESANPELRERNLLVKHPNTVEDKETKNMSKVGKSDTLQLIVGKLTAIKSANSNSDKSKITSELKKLLSELNDQNCRRYIKPMIDELDKRSVRDEDFDTIVDDFIEACSTAPVTKVFNNFNMNQNRNFSNTSFLSESTREALDRYYSVNEQRMYGKWGDRFKKWGKAALGVGAAGALAYGADRYLNGGKGMQAVSNAVSRVGNTQGGKQLIADAKAIGNGLSNAKDRVVHKVGELTNNQPGKLKGETAGETSERQLKANTAKINNEVAKRNAEREAEVKNNYLTTKKNQEAKMASREAAAQKKAEEDALVEKMKQTRAQRLARENKIQKETQAELKKAGLTGGGARGSLIRAGADVTNTVTGGVKNAWNRLNNWWDGGERNTSNIVTSKDAAQKVAERVSKKYSSTKDEGVRLFSDTNPSVYTLSDESRIVLANLYR